MQGSSEPPKVRTLPAAAYPTSAPPGGPPSPPACPQGPAHLTAPPRPAEATACARARGVPAGSPSERPRPACAVCAGGLRLFEQEGGHISPSRPPSPHPPRHSPPRLALSPAGTAAPPRSSPISSRRDPTIVFLFVRSPAFPLLSLHRASTSPCPTGHRSSSPSSDGTKWESEAVPRGPAPGRD